MQSVPSSQTADKPSLTTLIEELYGNQDCAATAWARAVRTVASHAKATLPEASASRVDKAEAIVLAGGVELLPGGKARITSQTQDGTVYHVCNGTCECHDFPRAPAQWCKHRVARGVFIRASRLFEAEALHHGDVQPPAADVPAEHIVHLHGRPFITYTGLLALAHSRGLVSLSAKFISVTSDIALAEATAVFADGKAFTEAADASPKNVSQSIKPHYARMALTRAKARALRDALNISMCSVEECE